MFSKSHCKDHNVSKGHVAIPRAHYEVSEILRMFEAISWHKRKLLRGRQYIAI